MCSTSEAYSLAFRLLCDPCVLRISSIRIYSRWGQEVFTGINLPPNDPLFAWNGRLKDRELPENETSGIGRGMQRSQLEGGATGCLALGF